MRFPLSSTRADLRVLDEVASTNSELMDRASEAHDFTATVTTSQTAGRGRLGRTWTARPGESLAVSVLLRPTFGRNNWGWMPLIAGVAMARAVASTVHTTVALKWPNDVLIDELKVCGILVELLPDGSGVVVGAGVNLEIDADRLPTPTSTSLRIHGAGPAGDALADAVCSGWLGELHSLYTSLASAAGDPVLSGAREATIALCTTLGRSVRIELPGASDAHGVAKGIDLQGRLEVEEAGGRRFAVAAGDVTHLRHE